LPLLLPQLHKFFSPILIADPETVSPYHGYFTFDDVPLKWHLPLGLLYDVYVLSTQDAGPESSGAAPLPFQLTLNFTQGSEKPTLPDATPVVLHDSFINSVKEADFLRSGTAKPIMTLSAQESKSLWKSTQDNDLTTFSKIHNSLIPSSGQMRNIPLRVYLPSSPDHDPSKAQIKVVQSHVPPTISATTQVTPAALRTPSGGQPQTLGNALHQVLPSIFPSRRTTMLGTPLLHGAPVPMNAHLEELYRSACYADGWLSIVVAMRG
jgi:autophagy-related protein 5